jgi:phosphatidylglycerophosphate synthase
MRRADNGFYDRLSRPPRPLRLMAGVQVVTVAAALSAATMALPLPLALGWRGWLAALSCYGLIVTFVVLDLGRHAPHQRFGMANSVTLGRAGVTALLWGVVGEAMPGPFAFEAELCWLLAGAAATALLLDGVDGWIARRSGMVSKFGADFDLEVDCLFVLALSLLVYAAGRAGAWVLMNGFMRYLFVCAGWLWPVLAAPLQPLRRRKVICAIQGAVLIAVLAPILPGEATPAVCLAALALLVYSFGADVFWLMAQKGDAGNAQAELARPLGRAGRLLR